MDATLPETNSKEDQRLKQLALFTYEKRSRFANHADYDWCQAKREVGFLQLATSIVELAAGFGEGRFRAEPSAISETVAKIRGQAQQLFEPIDVNLSEELMHTLARMERALANASNGRSTKNKAGVRRLVSWFKGPTNPQRRD
jgi:hypothetical protein